MARGASFIRLMVLPLLQEIFSPQAGRFAGSLISPLRMVSARPCLVLLLFLALQLPLHMLLQSYNPELTTAQLRQVLTGSALDIEGAGVDRNSGFGIVMALQALEAAPV